MKKEKMILVICLILCIVCSLQLVTATEVNTNSTDATLAIQDSDDVAEVVNSDILSSDLQDQSLLGNDNEKTFSELETVLNNGDSTIELVNNYTYSDSTDSALKDGIVIPNTVEKIDGKGNVIIDAAKQARIFNIASGQKITLTGITFVNANAIGNGGVINAIGDVYIENCNFINNTATGHGGAVYLDQSTDTDIINSLFEGNVAGLNGGALDWHAGAANGVVTNSIFINNTANRSGGAIHWSGHYGTISNSNFTNNSALGTIFTEIGGVIGGGDGGAVLWVGSHGVINNTNFTGNFAQYRGGAVFLHGNSTENCTNTTVTNCNFNDNVAGLNGGAVDWQSGANNGTLSYCNFTNNSAWRSGGAVYWYGTNGNVSYCNFTDNHAIGNVSVHDKGIVSYNTEGGNGGAITWTGSVGNVNHSRFIDNTAKNNGGAVYLMGGTASVSENTTFDSCVFISNDAGRNGGAVDWYRGAWNGTIINSVFNDNTANRSGGAIHWSGHYGTISNSNFTNNSALGTVIDDIGGFIGGGDGGAVIWVGSHGIIKDNCNFINNTARYRGGAIFLHGNSTENCTNTTVTNCNFENNVAGLNGGAIDWQSGANNGTLSYCNFTNNTAWRSGGAVYWHGTNGNVSYCNFTDNHAIGNVSGHDDPSVVTYSTEGGNGGAITWTGAVGNVDHSRFIDNTAKNNGGAVYLMGSSAAGLCENTTFDSCIFVGNDAGRNGGALDWYRGAENGKVLNSVFNNNTANRSGGAIHWSGHYGTISGSNFTNNHAIGNVTGHDNPSVVTYSTEGGNGGAITWTGSVGLVQYSNFTDNTAKNNGGAVYLMGSSAGLCENTTFDSCIFVSNDAGRNGGAVDWYRGAWNGTIMNSVFKENTANRSGGAIHWSGHYGTISGSNFTNNTAFGIIIDDIGGVIGGGDGGAVIWVGSHGIIKDSNFTDNFAQYRGGAIFLHGNSTENCTNTTVTNCNFNDNVAGLNGGAIDWQHGANNGTLSYSNFTNNTAWRSGGAVYWNGLYGEILYSNFDDNHAIGNVTKHLGSDEIVYSNEGGHGGAVIWTGSHGQVLNSNFTKNTAKDLGGAVYLQSGTYGECDNTTFDECIFESNAAGGNGGAIDWYRGAENGKVLNSVFYNNTANRSGGAIHWSGHYGTISGSNFTNNSALGIVTSEIGGFIGGGDGGAVIWVGSHGIINDDCYFINNTAQNRGGAIFLHGNSTENCTNTTVVQSTFINNTAGTNGGAIDWYLGATNGTVEDLTFINNTAKRSGGAIFWNGYNGTVRNSLFIHNHAKGEYLLYDMPLTMEDIIICDELPATGAAGKLYVVNKTLDKSRVYFASYVYVDGEMLQLDETIIRDSHASPTDWAIDQFFGGDGGSILWGGDLGLVDNCIFIESESARRGGGAYMVGSDNVTYQNSYFENCTSGTNGGGLDWLAGANYGRIYNCTFNNTRAARSAGAIYYDGDYGEIRNITIINATSYGGSLKESPTCGVKYAGWDSSHWDVNTTGGDAGGIMFTGDHIYVYNATFINCTTVGRGGAVFLQDNVNITFDLCTFENNRALGTANNTWNDYTKSRDDSNPDTKLDYKLTGHGGAIAFEVGAQNCTIKNSEFINNTGRRDGGAINFAVGALNNTIMNSNFTNNSARDDGGAINWEGDLGRIENIICYNNTATGREGSTSKGGTICLTGNNVTITKSNFTLSRLYANTAEGASIDGTDGGAIFVTGNNTNITDTVFDRCYSPHDAGAVYVIGDNLMFDNCTFTNCNATEDGGVLYILGQNAKLFNSTFTNNTVGDDGGAIYWEGDNGKIYNITCENNKAISLGTSSSNGGTIIVTGSNLTIDKSGFKDSYAEIAGGAIFITGNNVNITDSSFERTNVSQTKIITGKDYTTGGGAIYILGDVALIENCTFDETNGREGGAIYVQGKHAVIDNATSTNSYAINGGSIYIDGINATVSNSNISLTNASLAGGAIYINGAIAEVINTTFNHTQAKSDSKYVNTNLGGAIYISGNNAGVYGSVFDDSSAYSGGILYIKGDYANVTNSSFNNGYSYYDGGAFYSTGSYSNIYYSNFTSNEARGDGGAMYWYGKSNSRNNTIVGCEFIYNTAYAQTDTNTKGGGAIYWSEEGRYGTIRDSKFINNSVQSNTKADGGAILWDNCYYGVIDNCIFDGDYVETTNSGDVWVQGGAIYLRVKESFNITNSKFINCYSDKEGGALYAQSGVNNKLTILENVTFINNVAKSLGRNSNGGGALQIKQNDRIVLRNVTFINNTANQGGAVTVLDTGNNVTFIDCTFDGNTATTGNGGGIWANKKFYMYNTVIANGTAAEYGGGLYSNANIDYNNITFINNTAKSGGGLYWALTNAKIQNMYFINNTALERGGGIYIANSGFNIRDVNMTGNRAFAGSAIWSSQNIILTNVYLMENQANSSSLDIDFNENSGQVVILFKGKDEYLNAIFMNGGTQLTCTNVTYWDESGVTNTGETQIKLSTTTLVDTPEGGQNLTVKVYGDSGLLVDEYMITDNDGKVYIDLAELFPGENYHEMYVSAALEDDTYYTKIKATTRSPSEVTASASKTTYHSNSTIDVSVTTGATGNVSVYLDGVFLGNITLENSKGSVDISTLVNGVYLPVGNYTLDVVYNGNVKFEESNTTAILEINKITPVIIMNVTGIGYNLLVNVTVLDAEYDIADATGNITVKVDDRTATIFLGSGQGMTMIYGMPIGNYTVNLTYNGDNNYYTAKNSTVANVTEKTQTVLVLDVDSDKVYYINETVPIKVTILPKGEGNVTIYLNGEPHEFALQTVNNVTFVEFDATDLKDGINYVFATYEGTGIYAPSWAQDSFKVIKYNATVGINTANITYTGTEIINFTLPEDAEGILNITVNGSEYYAKITGGKANITLSGLDVGVYNVTVTFNGDKKYYNVTNSTLFNVSRAAPAVDISVENVTYGNETVIVVTLPDGVTGNVTVKINDTYHVFDTQDLIDGKAILPGVVLPAGNYTVEATYNGDSKYAPSTGKANFTVYRDAPAINVEVKDINYGENANITVTVPSGVTGTVVIKVNGTESEPLTITDGKVNLTVSGLAVGKYPVEVIYNGNDNFKDISASAEFSVSQIQAQLTVEVHDITVWDKEYINVTIKDASGAVIVNATGNVTINIDGTNHTAKITDGVARFNTSDLTVARHFVWVIYGGDRNLTGNNAMAQFNVGQRAPEINVTAQDINVGQTTTITIHIPENATGFVVVSGNFTKRPIYVDEFENGVATVEIGDLANGTYGVHIKYYGDSYDNYTTQENETTFKVSKLNATVTVEVEGINYTQTAVITVNVPGATGNVTIKLNDTAGTSMTKTIVDGKAVFDVSDLAAGNYSVKVTYNGNDDYNVNNTESAKFEVKKIDPNLQIYRPSVVAGENAQILIVINDRINGEYVTITGLDKDYTKEIMNGVVSFTTDGPLNYGTYTMIVTYGGNENFTDSTKQFTFTTAKISNYEINVTGINITVGQDEIITVKVPTGVTSVSIWVNGTKYTNDSFANGEAKFSISDLKEGVYTVNATVNDENYTSKVATGFFKVSKTYPSIEITVVNDTGIYVGDTVKVIVTVPEDVTENVTVEINGKEFTNATVNGNATFHIPSITYGNKTVVATYPGDDKYLFKSATANFTVNKRTPAITVTTDGPVGVGENITVTVDLPSNATGYVVVNVNGTNYTINITNGDYSVEISDLGKGSWNVTATYIGDDQYLPNSNKTSFAVNKVNSTMAISVEDINYGQNANITVTLPEDATGNVTIRINDTHEITLPVVNGKVNWIVDGLAVNNYTVYANYSGDKKYNLNNTDKVNKSFEVKPIAPDLEIIPAVTDANTGAVVTVKVNGTEGGKVNITVNGKDYEAIIENGQATATIDVLPAGEYDIKAIYIADNNYTSKSVTLVNGLTVTKVDSYDMNVTASDTTVGANTTITVNVPGDATGNVTIWVNGTKLVNTTIVDGKVTFNVSKDQEGRYVVNATLSDEKYANQTVTVSYWVSKVDTPMAITVVDEDSIYVGDTVKVIVTVPSDLKNNVTVEINGKKFTNTTVDGEATFYIPAITYGNKTVVSAYAGDNKYVSNSTTANFTVKKRQTDVEVNVTGEIKVGDAAVVNVTLPQNATGQAVVKVDGQNYTVNLTDGKGSVEIKGLANGTYKVDVTYLGDDQYLSATNSTQTIKVNKHDSAVTVKVENIIVGDTAAVKITVTTGASGNVTIKIGDEYEETVGVVDGTFSVVVPGLSVGNKTVNVTYNGNEKYLPSNSSAKFSVGKTSANIDLVVENITYGEVESIIAFVDAQGNVTIKLGEDVIDTVDIVDGKVLYDISGLNAGNYTLEIIYNGNGNTNSTSAKANFTVAKADPKITIEVKDIIYGDVEHIIVKVNAAGNVTIKVNGQTVDELTLENGHKILKALRWAVPEYDGQATVDVYDLEVGNYPVEVIYNGNENYNRATATADFDVIKDNVTVTVEVADIRVDGKEVINVTVNNTNVTGNVTINVDGVNHTVPISEGKANLTLDKLTNATHSVVVIYEGDRNFNGNWTSATFNVSKVKPELTIEVSNRTVGETETITVHLPENATGYVVVEVNGIKYHVDIVKGEAITLDVPKLENKTYTVKANYSGDGYYDTADNSTSFNVKKVNSTVTVKVDDITAGEVAAVNITVTTGASGNVTIKIGDEYEETVGVVDGTFSVVVPGLTVGNKTVNVTYNGNDKYLPSNSSATFEVSKADIPDSSINVVDQGNGTVVVTVPDNATGNVTIKVGNETYNATVVNGTATITLTNVTPGTHDIEVIYSGDENHTGATKDAQVTIPKYDSPITVSVDDIKVGDKAIVEVTLPENATGNVTIEINGKTYKTDNITDGVARFEVENLTYGNKTVAVTYSGDDNYTGNFTTANFTVDKRESFVNVEVEPANVGDDVTIKVTVPQNATGWVHVTIDNHTYAIKVNDGTGNVTVKGLASGTYPIDVEYLGDGQYFNSTNDAEVEISRVPASIKVSVENITAGENAVINIETPEDLCGNVTVTVDGKNYTVPVSGGKGTLVVSGLKADNYTVDVKFDGCKKYEPADNSTTFEVSKADIPAGSINVVDQGNGTVVVTVPDNATGNVTIKVGNETYNATVVNGTATVTLTNVTPGTHDIEVIYSGDENHTGATKDAQVTIPKLETPIKVTTEDIKVGNTTTITVEVPEDATGNVTIEIDGVKYSEEIKDGKAVFNIENLTAGNKTVAVDYVGDDNYTGNHTTGNFTVSKVAPEIIVKVNDTTAGDKVIIEVTAPSDVTRPVLVDVGGKGYYVNITDGKGKLELDDLTSGNYTVTAKYLGDDKYSDAVASDTFKVDKVPSIVSVEVDNITVGDKAVITVTVPKDATGNVTVTVDGKDYNVSVADGKGTLVIPNLKAGNYTVDATYNGDDKYESSSNSTKLEVSKKQTDDMKVIDQGNGTVVVVVGDNATGNVTVKVGNDTYVVPVENGTAVVDVSNSTPGTHDIEVIYSGDDEHDATSTDSTVTIPKLDTPISVDVEDSKVGDTTTITVNVPKDATGNVTIEIDGVKYSEEIKDGKAVFNIENLTAGNKTVAVDYVGDDNYTGNHTTGNFTVSKVPSTVIATIEDSKVGENVTVKVTVPEDATGQVLIDIDGVGYYVNVTDGTGTVEIPRIPNGKYDVNVTYVGDDKYLPSSSTASFDVDKVESFVVPSSKDIAVGDNEVIEFSVPEDATGNITVKIGDKEYSVPVSGGKGILVVADLPKGDYDVAVRYNGDDKYMPSSNQTSFHVSKKSTDMDIIDQGNGTIVIELPENATGNVTVKVGNQTYNVTVENGTAVVDLTNATPGTQEIEVIYSGDDEYGSKTKNATVTIPKHDTPITVDLDDIKVGDTAKITVNVPEDATGNVTIEINGKQYSATIENGKAVFNIKGLSEGDKTVAVKYSGDKNYVGNFTTANFTVSKSASSISATSKDIKVGKDEVITVTVPSDATGRVLVEIDGVGYYANIVNGKAKVIVPELPAGKYTAKVTYEGDGKYLPSTSTTKFTVTKNSAPIKAEADEITEGEDATVVVKLPEDATGTVTITVDGKKYTAEVENGKAVFKIPGLTKGDHDISAKYSGDKKYAANDTITDVEVNYSESQTHNGENGVSHTEGGVGLAVHETGNPILLLLLVILAVGSAQLRRIKK